MRILIANDRMTDPGGVQSYLHAVVPELLRRGHRVAVASCDQGSALTSADSVEWLHVTGTHDGVAAALAWAPDVCFSHNMHDLGVDEHLASAKPVVKFMHGHYGTCLSGLKSHSFPTAAPCTRPYGAACLALYFPRRCGSMRPQTFVRSWRWTTRQRRLFCRYCAIMVASEHMRREYAGGGLPDRAVVVNPLFPTAALDPAPSPVPDDPHVVFMARMATGKGGDLLIRAVADAASILGRPIRVTLAGDGPRRKAWQALAADLRVPAHFPGWLTGDARWPVLRTASVLAIPGEWPETFGLVGLEAGALGVPVVAVRAGGVSEWLREHVNGVSVAAPSSPRAFADALVSVLRDHRRQAELRQGAYQVAREMSLHAHVDRLEHVLRTAADRQQPRAVGQ